MFWTMKEDFGMNYNLGTEEAVAVAATAYAIYSLEEGPSRSNDRHKSKRINEEMILAHESGTKSNSKTIKDRAVSIKEQDTGTTTYPDKVLSNPKARREVPEQDHLTMKEVPKPDIAASKPARDDVSTIKRVKEEVTGPDLGTKKPAEEAPKPDLSISPTKVAKLGLPTLKPAGEIPKPDLGRKPSREVSKPDLGTAKRARDVPRPDLSTTKPGRDTPRNEAASSFKPLEQVAGADQKPRPISIEAAEVADDWERAEMTKIKQWYDNLNWTISSWEEKQKAKARQKLDRKERESDFGGREKALYKYRRDMEYIEEVVGGARAEAEEKQKRKELRAKAKANLIRTTGKVPMTCFCF